MCDKVMSYYHRMSINVSSCHDVFCVLKTFDE